MGKRRARLTKGIDAAIQIVGVDTAESRRGEALRLGLADAAYATIGEAVAAEHPDAALFVFSDDIDWARGHLDTAGLPAVFLPRGEAVADLAFMQLCRGFVLSNSTYSWWAQYLAPAPDKQTWAPDKWYAHTKKTALYQDGWQLIKTSPSGQAVTADD